MKIEINHLNNDIIFEKIKSDISQYNAGINEIIDNKI